MRELPARLTESNLFPNLKWSDVLELAKRLKNSNGYLGLPLEEPVSLESFQEIVGTKQGQKSSFLPRATISEIVSRGYDACAALSQASNSNEAEKVFVFNLVRSLHSSYCT
jgi:hypothetical protein